MKALNGQHGVISQKMVLSKINFHENPFNFSLVVNSDRRGEDNWHIFMHFVANAPCIKFLLLFVAGRCKELKKKKKKRLKMVAAAPSDCKSHLRLSVNPLKTESESLYY
jgi:membrane-anchored protein YejM (alkaline phosphatase superfamily)